MLKVNTGSNTRQSSLSMRKNKLPTCLIKRTTIFTITNQR